LEEKKHQLSLIKFNNSLIKYESPKAEQRPLRILQLPLKNERKAVTMLDHYKILKDREIDRSIDLTIRAKNLISSVQLNLDYELKKKKKWFEFDKNKLKDDKI
jgi:hypothetical protein